MILRRSCLAVQASWRPSLGALVLLVSCSNSSEGDPVSGVTQGTGSGGAGSAVVSTANGGSALNSDGSGGAASNAAGAIAIGSGGQTGSNPNDVGGAAAGGAQSGDGGAATVTGGGSSASGQGGAATADGGAPATGGVGTASASDPGYVYLSETGLYASGADGDFAEGVIEYTPRFALWTDGAEKRRFIKLPEGATIDTADMDNWEFPVGTKLWKQFALDGKVLETRILEKLNDEDEFLGWYMRAFVWAEDGSDAEVAPDGAVDVLGTNHDVPAKQSCRDCHFGRPDRVLGFGAIQLAHDDTATTLSDVIDAGLLSAPPESVEFPLPGNEVDQAALGYLHANCGHCHIPDGAAWEMTGMELHLVIDELGSVEETRAYVTAVNVDVQKEFEGVASRIVPKDLESSAVYKRMTSREDEIQMPNLGTEVVDDVGTAAIAAWIEQLE